MICTGQITESFAWEKRKINKKHDFVKDVFTTPLGGAYIMWV